MVSINENINKILLKNTYELSNIYVQIKIGRWLSHSLRRSFANIPSIKRISELVSKFESQAQRMITFILFVTHVLPLSVQKRMFRCTRVHKFIVWSIIFDKNWVCKKKNRQRSLCVWKWNLEIYNGEGERKKTQEGWLPSKGIYARRTREMGDPAWYWVTINERAMGWRYTRWGKALAGRNRRVEAIEVTVESSSNGAFGTTAEEPFAKMSIYVLSFDLIEKN